ncbi:hypothetical protein QCA50_006390 [Cerrena zonata]|uniref:RING-type domain-containing protein n=1 Tax=Cerrena zonata TaxID=2478898 RepID=A0AAW0G8T0_9APHY
MGQSSSRARLPATTPPNHPPNTSTVRSSPSNTNPVQRTVSPDGQRTKEKKQSRRQSVRQSFLGLVSRSPLSSTPSTPPTSDPSSPRRQIHSLRKRWRSSKRFSRASHVPQPEDISAAAEIPHISEADDRTLREDARPKPGPSSPTSLQTVPSRSSRPPTPFPVSRSTTPHAELPGEVSTEVLSEPERQLSQNIGTWLSGAVPPSSSSSNPHGPATSAHENIEQEINDFLNSDARSGREATSSGPAGPSQSLTDPTTEANTQASQPPRHFPPPGTLVVVQGVVNTTDAPHSHNTTTATSARSTESTSSSLPVRQRATSLPRSNHPLEEQPRNGLSSLLPRPHSMISNRPSTEIISPTTAGTESFDASTNGTSSPSEDSSRSGDTQETTPNPSETGHRALSPGSIDVLGTLLSVAATATAASLFSPSLAQVTSTASTTTTHPLSGGVTERPNSPTPTAGLGNLGGLNGLAGLNFNPPGSAPVDRDARERIRNVWESFRDRLGLNSRAQPGGGATNDGTGNIPTSATPATGTTSNTSLPTDNGRLRPGELMLAEMARALNAGLGLGNGQASSSQNERRQSAAATEARDVDGPDTPAAAEPTPRMPTVDEDTSLSPEAGFERFLLNLQADLRTILSTDTVGPSVPPPEQPSSTAATEEHDTEVVDSVQVPSDDAPVASSSTPPSIVHDHVVDDQDDYEHMSALESDSDTESESDDDESEHEEVDENVPPPRTPTPIPRSHLQQPARPTDSDWGTDERGRPTINLWRIYRFQPIPAPYSPSHAANTTAPPAPPTSPTETQPAPFSTADSNQAIPGVAIAPPPPNSEGMPGLNLNVVVPVIVVGLQSVDTGHDRDHDDDWPPHTHAHPPSEGVQNASSNTPATNSNSNSHGPSNTNEEPTPLSNVGGPRPLTPRGRTWQSRAANALRTLRPGRRAGSSRRTADANGSRTFLIYVIGGYYPPNHHMVTGSDSLDSYEALWELAELLGQVKPPVATKEEIEKSGLEIIKAPEMKRHEQDGKITSNCMDRCLVCLEDYEDEDDIRVMACKHAFHQVCVDRWLQVGRNNCPACRTKGVSTTTEATPQPPVSQTS